LALTPILVSNASPHLPFMCCHLAGKTLQQFPEPSTAQASQDINGCHHHNFSNYCLCHLHSCHCNISQSHEKHRKRQLIWDQQRWAAVLT